jgi:hypothetical protein
MPPIITNFTLGTMAAAIVMTTSTVIAAIADIVLATTGGLATIRGDIAPAAIRAAIATIARAGLVGAGVARCTSRILRSARPARVGVGRGRDIAFAEEDQSADWSCCSWRSLKRGCESKIHHRRRTWYRG